MQVACTPSVARASLPSKAAGPRSPLQEPSLLRPRPARRWRGAARAEPGQEGGAPSTSGQAAADDDGELLVERMSKRRGAGARASGPRVIAPAVEQVYGGGPLTPLQRAENAAVLTLGGLFTLILVEGVFLGGSGFLSEEVDQFAQDFVYPAFSPTVIVFLGLSSLYGVWKTGGLGGSKEDGSKKP